MLKRISEFVTRRWGLVIGFWVLLAVVMEWTAPRWEDVTYDGDLAYLPSSMRSVVGEKLVAEAFPKDRAKSQIIVAMVRRDRELDNDDIYISNEIAARFHNLLGIAALERATKGESATPGAPLAAGASRSQQDRQADLEQAIVALDEAISLDADLQEYWRERKLDGNDIQLPPPLAAALWNRSLVHEQMGDAEQARLDRERAVERDPSLADARSAPIPLATAESLNIPMVDLWTWHDPFIGTHLVSRDKHARLVVLHLPTEFMATDNIAIVERVEKELAEARQQLGARGAGLELAISGSAAVGGDMLRSAAQSIKSTEWVSIALVVLILVVTYRSPLLIAAPIISIVVSLIVATDLVAMLTQLHLLPGFHWWDFKIFTTTKIFIVVILWGAGTDYCLFLIARYREQLAIDPTPHDAAVNSLVGVADAVLASGLTTILGLAVMAFADFGKYRYSGPVIAICLTVTLLVCLTLTPAFLRACGPVLFWPSVVRRKHGVMEESPDRFAWLWEPLARMIVAHPGWILGISVLVMSPLAVHGWRHGNHVTYDLLSELPAVRPSKRAAELLKPHFPVGDSGPVTVVMRTDAPLDDGEARTPIRALTDALYVEGVESVRSSEDPLGLFRPGQKRGIFSERARKSTALRNHRRVKEVFVAEDAQRGGLTRLEVILNHDPFSLDAIEVLNRIESRLRGVTAEAGSFWQGATFSFAGTTAGIRDLRTVTRSDNVRIKILVVLAVFLVLLAILRRPWTSAYMMLTVLFSFYVTIGGCQLFFAWSYGDSFHGLDWKVPLFLFVILVAIGQDYNVYLATRVFEEQSLHGPLGGLRRAIVKTGGIITSCGVIMAGTFVAMTSCAWGPAIPAWMHVPEFLLPREGGALRGIVEIGFALATGVLLDTLIVRTVLVPAYLALVCRWQPERESKRAVRQRQLATHNASEYRAEV